jgi:hypothetical protein
MADTADPRRDDVGIGVLERAQFAAATHDQQRAHAGKRSAELHTVGRESVDRNRRDRDRTRVGRARDRRALHRHPARVQRLHRHLPVQQGER